MVFVLCIGDLHIPYRIHGLPSEFKNILVPGKVQQILCTGNICDKETHNYLQTVSSDLQVVQGDYDESDLPLSITLTHGELRIGLIHGHQSLPWGDLDALSCVARKLDVDVLVSGHTHKLVVEEHDGRYFVNPGSATGAWNANAESPTPSFVFLDIQETTIVTHAYFLERGKVEMERTVYRKPSVTEKKPDAKEKEACVEIDLYANSFGAQGCTIPQPLIIRESSSPSSMTKDSSKDEVRYPSYQWQPRGPFNGKVTRRPTPTDPESPPSAEEEKYSSKDAEGYLGYRIRGPTAHWIKSGMTQQMMGTERGKIPAGFAGGSSGSNSSPSLTFTGGGRMREPRR